MLNYLFVNYLNGESYNKLTNYVLIPHPPKHTCHPLAVDLMRASYHSAIFSSKEAVLFARRTREGTFLPLELYVWKIAKIKKLKHHQHLFKNSIEILKPKTEKDNPSPFPLIPDSPNKSHVGNLRVLLGVDYSGLCRSENLILLARTGNYNHSSVHVVDEVRVKLMLFEDSREVVEVLHEILLGCGIETTGVERVGGLKGGWKLLRGG